MTQEEIKELARKYAITSLKDNDNDVISNIIIGSLARGYYDGLNAAYNHARGVAERDAAKVTVHSAGVELIAAERILQITTEHFDSENDDRCKQEELATAAMCYASPLWVRRMVIPYWPFRSEWWKPNDDANSIDGRIRELTKAGALIAAEIDRLKRLKDE